MPRGAVQSGVPGPEVAPGVSGRVRRRQVRPAAVAGLLVVGCVLGWVLLGVATDRPVSDPAPPPRDGVLLVPVVPVGGDLLGAAGDRQSLRGAIGAVEAIAGTAAGGIWLTADLRWLCPTQTCDVTPLTPVVDRAVELGLRVYLHVNSSPTWLSPEDRWLGPTESDARAWAECFAQLVEAFGTTVHGYEIWNEPNNDEFWTQGPDPVAYAALVRAVWTAVQQVEPAAALVAGALSNNDLGYLAAFSRALGDLGGDASNGYFYDQLGVHPYAGDAVSGYDPALPAGAHEVQTEFGTKDMTFRGLARMHDQVLRDEGIDRPVVVGEFGYDTTPDSFYHVAEPTRSEYLADAIGASAGWEWLVGFTVYDHSTDPDDGFSILGTPSERAVFAAAAALDGS